MATSEEHDAHMREMHETLKQSQQFLNYLRRSNEESRRFNDIATEHNTAMREGMHEISGKEKDDRD